MITRDYINSILHYNPETGVFTWAKPVGKKIKIGMRAGTLNPKGYRVIIIAGKIHREHRLAFLCMTGEMPLNEVDHINGVRDDNRWINLRLATKFENQWNQKKPTNNTSGLKGVCWNKRDKRWVAKVGFNGDVIYLGGFSSKNNAEDAVRRYRERLHGKFTNHG